MWQMCNVTPFVSQQETAVDEKTPEESVGRHRNGEKLAIPLWDVPHRHTASRGQRMIVLLRESGLAGTRQIKEQTFNYSYPLFFSTPFIENRRHHGK
jgi:hypothetical protein